MVPILQKLKLSLKNNSTQFTVLTILFYGLILLATTEKEYCVVTILYGTSLFLLQKFTLIETVFFTLLFSLPFEHGIRSWHITTALIQIGTSMTNQYHFYFGISLKLIFSITLLLLIAAEKKANQPQIPHSFIVWIGLIICSTALNSDNSYAWLGLIRFLVPFTTFVGAITILPTKPHFLRTIALLIMCSACINAFVGSMQLVVAHPLGIMIEDTNDQKGLITTSDGMTQSRVSGLTGHPTILGPLLTMYLPIIIALLQTESFYFMTTCLFMIATSLIGTLSRSAWFSTSILAGIHAFNQKKASHLFGFFLLILLAGLTNSTFVDRIQSLPDIFITGSGVGRINLIARSLTVIAEHPYSGVGLNNFVTNLVTYELSDSEKGFLYPVHNTWLLLASETGIPATLCFVYGIIRCLLQFGKSPRRQPLRTAFFLGSLIFLINSQFHPLLLHDPNFDYFMLYLGILAAKT